MIKALAVTCLAIILSAASIVYLLVLKTPLVSKHVDRIPFSINANVLLVSQSKFLGTPLSSDIKEVQEWVLPKQADTPLIVKIKHKKSIVGGKTKQTKSIWNIVTLIN